MVRQGAVCKTFSSSTRIWFRSARTSFTGRKARARCSSNRRCCRTRFCSAAATKMNGARARKIWRHHWFGGGAGTICATPVFRPDKLAPLSERLIAADRTDCRRSICRSARASAGQYGFLRRRGADSIALAGGIWIWREFALRAVRRVRRVRWSRRMSLWRLGMNESWRIRWFVFRLGRESTLEEVEFAEQVLPEVIRRAQRCRISRGIVVNDLSNL